MMVDRQEIKGDFGKLLDLELKSQATGETTSGSSVQPGKTPIYRQGADFIFLNHYRARLAA
jgi:hypothetical protein